MIVETVYPDVVRLLEERKELMRLCAVRMLKTRPVLSVEDRTWAEMVAAYKPLGRPLTDGAPRAAKLGAAQ